MVSLLRLGIEVAIECVHSWDDTHDACFVLREERSSVFVGLYAIV